LLDSVATGSFEPTWSELKYKLHYDGLDQIAQIDVYNYFSFLGDFFFGDTIQIKLNFDHVSDTLKVSHYSYRNPSQSIVYVRGEGFNPYGERYRLLYFFDFLWVPNWGYYLFDTDVKEEIRFAKDGSVISRKTFEAEYNEYGYPTSITTMISGELSRITYFKYSHN